MVEAFWVRDVEHEYTAMSPTIVACRQSSEPFLTSRVPHLEPYSQVSLTVQKCLRFAIDSNRWLVILRGEGSTFPDTHQYGSLARACVANDYHLVLFVESLF